MRAFLCLSITLVAICHPLAIRAQDPVIKPTAGARGGRLPAPKTVTATQESDGRIRVVWNAVAGATSYRIVRSVPPAAMAPLTPNKTDTVFFDSDVNAGSTYYYQIAAVDEGGLLGLNKAASAPVKAVRSAINAGGNEGEPLTPRPPTNVVAAMRQESRDVEVTWDYGGRSGLYFVIETTRATGATAWNVYDRIGPSRPGMNFGHNNLLADNVPEGTQLKFRVSAIDSATGARSTPTESNVVTIAHGSASCATSNSDATAGSGGGTIVAHTGKTVSLRVGGTVSTATVIPATAQWISFDPHIATVDAYGTIKGISAGCAQMIASSRWGGINIYLVVVTVQP